MLVLSRKIGQSIEVDGPATIHVVGGVGKVKLGVEAVRETKVIRSELKTLPKPTDIETEAKKD